MTPEQRIEKLQEAIDALFHGHTEITRSKWYYGGIEGLSDEDLTTLFSCIENIATKIEAQINQLQEAQS